MPTVSYSETSTYLLCRRRHFYGYGMSLERLDTSVSLSEGKLGHAVLEEYYRLRMNGIGHELARQGAFIKLADYEPSERRADLRQTLTTYFENEPFLSQGYTVLGVEQQFNLEWDSETESRYPFVVDLILRDPWNQVAIVDHKFIYEFMSDEAIAIAPQIPLYMGALRALGYPADYGIYNMLRTRKIKEPRVDQQVGIAFVRPTAQRVVESFRQHAALSHEIAYRKAQGLEWQNENSHRVSNAMVCNSCSFKALCIGELIGDNTELIIRDQYQIRERREFAEITQEIEA